MTIKIIAALITVAVNAGAAVVIFLFMLLAMNGFHESDAGWGLGAYIAIAAGVTLLMGISAFAGVHLLTKRGFSRGLAVIISIAACSIVGVIAEVVSSVGGVAIADFVRRSY